MRTERTGWIKASGLLVLGVLIGVAVPGQQSSTAKEQKRIDPPRIGYVNVAAVLRDFKWANQEGTKITKRREEFAAKVNEKREAIASITKEYSDAKEAITKLKLKERIDTAEAELKSVDAEAERVLTEVSNQTIARVYEQFKVVIREMAEERGLDVVELFPAALRAEDEMSPQVAKLMLQTPALMPFYLRPELDLTQDVIVRINKKYPSTDD